MLRRLATLATLSLALVGGSVAAAAPASAADTAGPTAATTTASDEVTGYRWNAIDVRTMTPLIPGAHLTIAWGGVLRGHDGCNDFWGHASVNAEDRTVAIDIEGMTRRECFVAPSIDATALEGTSAYYVYADRLTLSNPTGARFAFTRA